MAAFLALLLLFPATGLAQGTVRAAAEDARVAWLAHDLEIFLPGPDPVAVGLPGVEGASSLAHDQAVALLREFLDLSEEVNFSIRSVNQTSDDFGFVEARREYVITGTAEIRRQRILIGFRLVRGVWRPNEIRISDIVQGRD